MHILQLEHRLEFRLLLLHRVNRLFHQLSAGAVDSQFDARQRFQGKREDEPGAHLAGLQAGADSDALDVVGNALLQMHRLPDA